MSTLTLADLIASHEQRDSEPISGRAVITPKGHATVSVLRLEHQIAGLEPADRHYVLARLADLLDGSQQSA